MRKLFIIALLGLLAACTQNSEAPLDAASAPMIETQTYNASITVTRKGNAQGRTVLLIPGLASSIDVWENSLPYLNDFDVRLVQLAGFAEAQAIDGQSIESITQAILEHLEQAPGQDTILVGHSLGGFLGLNIALESPKAVSELVIVDSLPFLAGMMMPATPPEQAAGMAQAMAGQIRAMPRELFDQQQALGLPRLVKDQNYLPLIKEWSLGSDQTTVANLMSEVLSADLRDDLADLQIPVTVFVPYDQSMGVPKANVQSLYTTQYVKAPKVDIQMVDGSYHFIMFDQAEQFKQRLLAALK